MKVQSGDYDIESFCQKLIDTDPAHTFEGFHYNHAKVYFYLTEDDWLDNFENNYEIEDYGEVYKLTREYVGRFGETDQAVYYAHYFDDSLLMLFTATTEEAKENTLDLTVQTSPTICEMPIVPQDFQRLHKMVLEENPSIRITGFKAHRIPDLAEAEIRPDYNREIKYKGEDGKQTLQEFKQYYGVVPTRVEYREGDIEIKIDKSGKFTIKRSTADNFTLLFDLIREIQDHVLDIQEVSQRIKFRTERRNSGELQLEFPSVTAGQIDFHKSFNLLMAEEFIESAGEEGYRQFTFTDVSKEAGSLDFSATVTDEVREATFNISATQDSMKIVPKHDCEFPTIVHFFHLVTETIDERATINVFDTESAYATSAP
ncbi:hypothetical protein [Halorubrum tebenquichense]|uniref:Uncharacterized protein n=1 Tax=Halorubrum tebenquichense DSM 14210 TaxID=1227485 RepID=M0E166_9EURY|nr:hypothetical protein [Halorubrum tebenquichense]ELZ40702.1 hypothetical protein C472_01519 [Halorubrum tebenquichense DSM 14210]